MAFAIASAIASAMLAPVTSDAQTSSSELTADDKRTVRSLFAPVAGLRRVGGAFPVNSAVAGRQSVYDVTGTPLESFDRFVRQARAHGFSLGSSGSPTPYSSGTCALRMPPGLDMPLTSVTDAAGSEALTCHAQAVGAFGGKGYTLTVDLRWGEDAHDLLVALWPVNQDESPGADLVPTPTVDHLPQPRRSVVPTGGEPIGPRFNAFSDGKYRRLRVEEGTRAVLAPTDPRYVLLVLRVDTGVGCGRMLRAYAKQLGDASISRSKIVGAGSAPSGYAEPVGGGGAFLACDATGRTLLITGGSD